jgi:hypothetical protein
MNFFGSFWNQSPFGGFSRAQKETIMPTTEISWQQPITVQLQNGAERRFTGAYEALDFLENEWPIRRGGHYDNAIRLCRAALLRATPVEAAREAFVAACLEAALPWRYGSYIAANRARSVDVAA